MLKYNAVELDRAFRALADGTRRGLVDRLCAGPASVSDLAAQFPMSLPAVHQHLQILAASGLVAWEKRGRVRWCRLETRRLRDVEDWVLGRRLAWQRRLDALAAHLADDNQREGKRHDRAKRGA